MDSLEESQLAGLSTAEAAQRLANDGPNELPQARRRTIARIAMEVVREPMFQLLVAAALVYLLLGDAGEALMLLAFVVMIVVITLVQERRTERVLEALRDLTSPRALVVRDAERVRVAGREVVRGDLLVLHEGDRVPADALLLAAHDLQTDESLLTGEAVPVRKIAAQNEPPGARPGGDNLPWVYAGTVVVDGQGMARVHATGAASEMGRIGKALFELEPPLTPLRIETRRMVRVFSIIGLTLSTAVVVLYGLIRGNWLEGVLAGIALAMSMLPQELFLILTVFLAMGAWRMSHQHVLTRRAATIETLGAATVLCTDKTGTMTQNRMAIAELASTSAQESEFCMVNSGPIAASFHELLDTAVLASEPDPLDPMDRAIHLLAERCLPAGARHEGWILEHEYSLNERCLAMSHVWRPASGDNSVVAIKGAPEAVAALCRLDAAQDEHLQRDARAMATRGLRVLAVARAEFSGEVLPDSPEDFRFRLLGLLALADPLRATVPGAIEECRAAGIKVVMITGDYPATAGAIAQQAGISSEHGMLTGEQVAAMGDAELSSAIANVTVFARVLPEQKLRIIQAFKARGEVVAMTGDGVNDAPSLKAAHIGIAMGGRGTDVAREASSLVLLDDDFGSIVKAIRLGRRIYDNLRKAMAFVLAVHVPIAGLALLPLLFGWPIVFFPAHIAFLELVIDPVGSFVFEAEDEEQDIMGRPPRDPQSSLFSPRLIAWSLIQGVLILLTAAAFFLM
ncbi:MAG: HAD-IC family P-type ATPase, partial [Burkholderiaceae bacterium]|nr:HAD-IC family P-type ATPase [Burkholderiaceae bacterium]